MTSVNIRYPVQPNYNKATQAEFMDCYIVTVSRPMASKGGQGNENAGLVERVGDMRDSKAFSSCQGLVNMLRGEPHPEEKLLASEVKVASAAVVRIVPINSVS